MGTTQRISPGVPGEPNWGGLNRAITQIAKTVEKEEEGDFDALEDQGEQETEQGQQLTPEQEKLANEYRQIVSRRQNHLKSAFKNLVSTGGGKRAIVKGQSKSIGKAGIRSAGRMMDFFTAVRNNGLEGALSNVGFDVAGKSVQEVINFLQSYSSDSSTGMDETAASKASCEVLNELARQSGNDLNTFEELLSGLSQGNEPADLFCRFWGYYIFEHLSQRFQEKVTQQKGEEISSETFRVIKEDILGQVAHLNENRNVTQIDWQGQEGRKEIERIFESIINILCDEN
jgi:hypothetical protein